MKKPVCVVAGVGPGNGAALATRFSEEDYSVALLARRSDFTSKLSCAAGHGRSKTEACSLR